MPKPRSVLKSAAKKTGRPSKQARIDKRVFENLCRIICTEIEICSVLEVSVPTLWRWCRDNYGETFEKVHKKLSAEGKASLRRAQLKLALAGNATMLIWLGKQLLGQTDKLFAPPDELDELTRKEQERVYGIAAAADDPALASKLTQ